MNFKKAFSMTEVLIIFIVIGFIFTLMVPHVIQKEGTKKFIESTQIHHSKLQRAFNKAAEANKIDNPLDWPSVKLSENKAEAIVKELSSYIPIMSFCGNGLNGCFSTGEYRTLNGILTNVISDDMKPYQNSKKSFDIFSNNEDSADTQKYKKANPKASSSYISLIDGGSVAIKTNSTRCDGIISAVDGIERPYCGNVYIDINGASMPNTLGVDVFGFYLSEKTLIPMGFFGDAFDFNNNCLREKPKAKDTNGLACSAWVIKNKNMEYRKCQAGSRITWTEATTCEQGK